MLARQPAACGRTPQHIHVERSWFLISAPNFQRIAETNRLAILGGAHDRFQKVFLVTKPAGDLHFDILRGSPEIAPDNQLVTLLDGFDDPEDGKPEVAHVFRRVGHVHRLAHHSQLAGATGAGDQLQCVLQLVRGNFERAIARLSGARHGQQHGDHIPEIGLELRWQAALGKGDLAQLGAQLVPLLVHFRLIRRMLPQREDRRPRHRLAAHLVDRLQLRDLLFETLGDQFLHVERRRAGHDANHAGDAFWQDGVLLLRQSKIGDGAPDEHRDERHPAYFPMLDKVARKAATGRELIGLRLAAHATGSP